MYFGSFARALVGQTENSEQNIHDDGGEGAFGNGTAYELLFDISPASPIEAGWYLRRMTCGRRIGHIETVGRTDRTQTVMRTGRTSAFWRGGEGRGQEKALDVVAKSEDKKKMHG